MVIEKEIKSVYKVDLLDGEYTGEMSAYTVTVIEGPITTYFKCDVGTRTYDPMPCRILIQNGYATVTLL